MAELIIESVPSGAEVQMGGEVVGITPLTIPINDGGLEAFRAECLSNGEVSCDWDTLKIRLEDQTVSRLWWKLTYTERRSIAVESTKNTLCFRIYKWRAGQPDCAGGEGDWLNADCGNNGVVRVWKFGIDAPEGYHAYWQDPATKIEHCYVPDVAYNLPCYSASVGTVGFGHELATIQIGEDVTDINNWVFFQYGEYDIRPGLSWQFPTPSDLIISKYGGVPIVEIDVPLDELAVFRAECLSNGEVSCDWDTLKIRLEDQTVSRLWWKLTYTERRSIAEMAIKNTLFQPYTRGRAGGPNCIGGYGDTCPLYSVHNAMIRYTKFTPVSLAGLNCCYYRLNESAEEFCYAPEYSYGLPGHIVECATPIDDPNPYEHIMCAIQVNSDTSTMDSWIVFQYSDFDIKPGDYQMRLDTFVSFDTPYIITDCGAYSAHTVAEFEI